MFRIQQTSPNAPAVCALIAQHRAFMQSLYPAEHNYSLDATAMLAKACTLFAAYHRTNTVCGCIAVVMEQGTVPYAELKSLFVLPSARGHKIGQALLEHAIAHARTCGAQRVCLETGGNLTAAHTVFHRCGFHKCPPFGAYRENPYSVFMEKHVNHTLNSANTGA